MSEQNPNTSSILNVSSDETRNSAFANFNNPDIDQHVTDYNLNQDINDPLKYLDLQRMLMEQGNTMVALKISEYKKALIERDNIIKSLHKDMMNSQSNSHVLSNQYQNIKEKTKSVNDTCMRLNSSFSDICDRLNRLGNTVDSARARQQDIINLVDQTTKTFQEKIRSLLENIDDSLKQDKIRTKQELELLENKFSLDLLTYKTNLEEFTTELENLKAENTMLSEKLNDANTKLSEEREFVISQNKHSNELKSQNMFLISQNKSLSDKYEEIIIKNQTLSGELDLMKTFLDENKNQLDDKLTIIKEQADLLKNLHDTEELNKSLQNENFTLKEHIENLEKLNTKLIDDIRVNESCQNEIQKNEFQEMCKNYDELLKIQEEKISDITAKLQSQKEQETKIQNEVIDLKQSAETCNKIIFNLQEEVNANYILIPELQNKIEVLNSELAISHQKLHDCTEEFMTGKKELDNDKIELENQIKEHLQQIEDLTSKYMKYKLKAKQLYVEVMKLRNQYTKSTKKLPQRSNILETIEILSDEANSDNDDVSIIEFNDQNTSNPDIRMQSISNKVHQGSYDSSLKRNSSPIKYKENFNAKKFKVGTVTFQKSTPLTKIFKQNNDIQQTENILNSSIRNLNINYEHKTSNTNKENIRNDFIVMNTLGQSNNDSISNANNKKFDVVNESMVAKKLNSDIKKIYKIPDDLLPANSKKGKKRENYKKKDLNKSQVACYSTTTSSK